MSGNDLFFGVMGRRGQKADGKGLVSRVSA